MIFATVAYMFKPKKNNGGVTMFKNLNRVGILAFFLSICFLQTALADQLVINGGYAFLADGDLKIYNINNPADSDPQAIVVGGAVEVAISGTNAVVTVSDTDGLSIQNVDISAYVGGNSDTNDCDQNRFMGQYDADEGLITLPGVDLDGTIFTLVMERRGNSNNWRVIFSEEVADDVNTDGEGDDDSTDTND
jgi:hypothetical protein